MIILPKLSSYQSRKIPRHLTKFLTYTQIYLLLHHTYLQQTSSTTPPSNPPHPLNNNLILLPLLPALGSQPHMHIPNPPRQTREKVHLTRIHDRKPRHRDTKQFELEVPGHVGEIHEFCKPLCWIEQEVGGEEEGCGHCDDKGYCFSLADCEMKAGSWKEGRLTIPAHLLPERRANA